MKLIHQTKSVAIPEGVKVRVKSRVVTVTGPRGSLTRSFKHLQLDIRIVGGKVLVEVWWGDRKHLASVRTVTTHIKNLMIGVTKGYQYNMRLVYAHFPIIAKIEDDGSAVEITNFVGQKFIKKIPMLEGVKITRSDKVKDQLELRGNDIEKVSQSAANIFHTARVHNKDIRKFLDGIYVSEKGLIGQFGDAS